MRDKLKEYAAVEEAAMKFVRSVAEGDSTYAKELFTNDAVLFGMLDGVLEHGSIDQFYHNVDTVGAGDSFTAAFISGILKGMTVADAHSLAVRTSAYVCTKKGAMPILPVDLIG